MGSRLATLHEIRTRLLKTRVDYMRGLIFSNPKKLDLSSDASRHKPIIAILLVDYLQNLDSIIHVAGLDEAYRIFI